MTMRERRLEARIADLEGQLERAQDAKPPRTASPQVRAVRPSAGLGEWYRKKLQAELEAMNRSVQWWVRAAYRKQLERVETGIKPGSIPVKTAADAAPADLLQQVLDALRRRWGRRFDRLGWEIAERFAERVGVNTDDAVTAALRAASVRVKFQTTRAQEDQLAATIQENVALIRSIHQQFHAAIEGAVMRSVRAGRDLGALTDDLQAAYGVSFRRASLIARDQNNKATAYLNRTRQIEMGVEQAVWVHSGGGKEPRPSHVKAGRDKVVYNVAEGWLDPATGKRIWPGTEINCRCTSRSIIPVMKQEAA